MLITGSLGSGKTTLLKHILDSAIPVGGPTGPAGGSAARIAVLMNEFGELGIDSRVISGENIDIIELAGGCVCCSMTGEFEAAVREILESIGPDFIVVEATGVAESDALVFEVEDNLPEVRLDSVVCIVDAWLGARYPYVGYTSRTQIASADIILINKVDLVTPAEAGSVENEARKYNDRATFLRTVNCSVDTNLLLGQTSAQSRLSPLPPPAPQRAESLPERPRSPSRTVSIPAAVTPRSFSWTTGKVLDRDKFDRLVRELPPELIRAKGFVRFQDGGRLFNYVVGRVDYEEFDVDRTELVFIGKDMDRRSQEIKTRLKDCVLQR
jgi:G3E family GTPase